MLLPEGLAMSADDVAGAMNQLHLDPAAVEKAHAALTEIVQLLQGDDFQYMGTIQQRSFGGNTVAENLSYHHGLAHQVMTDTLNGVVQDMNEFVTNLKQAVTLVQNADQDSRAALTSTTSLVQAMSYLTDHSAADQQNQHARTHHHDPFRPDGTPVELGGGS